MLIILRCLEYLSVAELRQRLAQSGGQDGHLGSTSTQVKVSTRSLYASQAVANVVKQALSGEQDSGRTWKNFSNHHTPNE